LKLRNLGPVFPKQPTLRRSLRLFGSGQKGDITDVAWYYRGRQL